MSQQTDTVTKFLASVKSGQLASDLLTADAGFQALNINLKGKEAVVERFKGGNYAEANWAAPEDKAGAVQAVGTLPNGAKLVLTVHGDGGKISLLQQQMLPGSPRPAAPLKIPADLKERLNTALVQRHPIMITYVDETGQPNLIIPRLDTGVQRYPAGHLGAQCQRQDDPLHPKEPEGGADVS